MNNTEVAELLCDIIHRELSLPQERISLQNSGFRAPNDSGLYVVVSLAYINTIASSLTYPEGDRAEQRLKQHGTFNIDFTSQGEEAAERISEFPLAIDSFYSIQLQERHHISITKLPQISNLSFVEGPSSLNRFRMQVLVDFVTVIEKPVEYFDKSRATEVVL